MSQRGTFVGLENPKMFGFNFPVFPFSNLRSKFKY